MTVPTWYSDAPEPRADVKGLAWLRVALKGAVLATLVFGCLALSLLLRLLERPLFGQRRPWTPHITVFVCRNAFRVLGMGWREEGAQMAAHGALVANHVSWLDIFALNASAPLYFVSKAEVAGWPGIGWLARATGTVFIRRARSEARAHRDHLRDRLDLGHRLLFFPEGTSTDGLRLLPFRPTLFAAATDSGAADFVQPVTLIYHAPPGERADFYGWWGDMGFGDHLLRMLAARRHGHVRLIWHAPIPTADRDRKSLAREAEAAVRAGLERHHPDPSRLGEGG